MSIARTEKGRADLTANESNLGSHLGTHRAAGGFTGFQNSPFGRTLFLTIAGAAVGFIPGLLVTLVTDLVIALVVFPIIGGAIAYTWSRRNTFEAAVTEARLHERGMILVNGLGTHQLQWADVAALEGRRIQNVLGAGPGVDIKGAVNSMYVVTTRDGRRFLLDNRLENVDALAQSVARAAGVPIARLR